MNKIIYIQFLLVIYIATVSCVSNTTYDSMKIRISQFNKAGNDFFNLIRNPTTPNKMKDAFTEPNSIITTDFNNSSIFMTHLSQGSQYFLSYYILFVVGITFVILFPIAGLLLLCCYCCKCCGANSKVMDPPNARCKVIAFGLILVILATAMLFGIVICLLNNQIVHEVINNEDKSINIFTHLKSNFQSIKQALIEVKTSINNAPDAIFKSQHLQGLSNNLNDIIKEFYLQLVGVPEVVHVIDQTKSFKLVLGGQDRSKLQQFIQNLNGNLTNLINLLATMKERIKEHLKDCNTSDCTIVKTKSDQLKLSIIEQSFIDKINTTLDLLESADFQSGLTKIIDFKEISPANMKTALDEELKYIKEKLSEKTFSGSMKSLLSNETDRFIKFLQTLEKRVPSLTANETSQRYARDNIKMAETYRYYLYIVLCAIILLIIVCYYFGLLFGTFGERPTGEASCCNRGVGARFMNGAIVLSFLFSSVMMIVVLGNMLTTGVIHTDMCRYTTAKTESDAKMLDVYVNVTSRMFKTKQMPQGIFDAVINRCPNQNFYSAFLSTNRQLKIKNVEPFLKGVDNKIMSVVQGQINLTGYLNRNPFASTSTIDLQAMVNSVALLDNEDDMKEYLRLLTAVAQQYPSDATDMRQLNANVTTLRTILRVLVQYLNNCENEYIRWKMVGTFFDNNKVAIVNSKSPQILSQLQTNLIDVFDNVFSEMFVDVSCQNVSSGVSALFNTICQDLVDPLNGTWYGIGFYLLLKIPALIFACLLSGLYSRIEKYFPDRDETDYDNYIGFYARGDPDSFKSQSEKKSSRKGYQSVPLQTMS